MGYIIFALIAMGVLLGFSYVVVYGCLFIVWLISLFFDCDERRKQREETERSTEMFHQITEELKAQNEAMRQQIERKKIENQQKREEIAREQNKDQ